MARECKVRAYSVDCLQFLPLRVFLTTFIKRSGVSSPRFFYGHVLWVLENKEPDGPTGKNGKNKMKKILSFFSIVLIFALTLTSCKKDDTTNNGNNDNNESAQTGYVDLGLPSGPKWKASNETKGDGDVFYTYDEAVSTFGDKLPAKEQFDELLKYCIWEWLNNGGYKVTGTNGNSIVLPAAGYRRCDGGVYGVGSSGYYWSSTLSGSDSDHAWKLGFYSGGVSMSNPYRCYGYSVRLVQD